MSRIQEIKEIREKMKHREKVKRLFFVFTVIIFIIFLIGGCVYKFYPRDDQTDSDMSSRSTIPVLQNQPVRVASAPPAIESSSFAGQYFAGFEEGVEVTGDDDEMQADLWGPEVAVPALNDSHWNLELFINETKTDKHLHIVAHIYDGDQISSTRSAYILSDCLNASVWAFPIVTTTAFNVVVAGTHNTSGTPRGFLYLLLFDGVGFTTDDAETELYLTGGSLYITDLKVEYIDSDDSAEIVLCGFEENTTSYDAFLWIWNVSTAGPNLVSEHNCIWSDDDDDLIAVALDVGDLDQGFGVGEGMLPEIAVVGNTVGTVDTYSMLWLFDGATYNPNANLWVGPNQTNMAGAPSLYYDVKIADVDEVGHNETVIVGSIMSSAAVAIFNWTDSSTAPVLEDYQMYIPAGYDYNLAVFYECEVNYHEDWNDTLIILSGKGNVSVTGLDRLVVQVWTWNGTIWRSISNVTSSETLNDISYWQELRVGDADEDGLDEVMLCWTFQDGEDIWYRNDTVLFGVVITEPPDPPAETPEQGRYWEETAPSEVAGRAPHPHPEDKPAWKRTTFVERFGWWLTWSFIIICATVFLTLFWHKSGAKLGLILMICLWLSVILMMILAPQVEAFLGVGMTDTWLWWVSVWSW